MRKLSVVVALLGIFVSFTAFADHHHRRDGYIYFSGNGWNVNIGNPPIYQNFYPPPMYYQFVPQPIFTFPQNQQITITCPPATRLYIVTDQASGRQSYICS